MICILGQIGAVCPKLSNTGECLAYYPEGVAKRMHDGVCILRNTHSESKGIYEPKASKKKKNPQKASKASA